MKPADAIQYFADFYEDFDKDKAVRMVTDFGLDPHQRFKTMSKGQQEKLSLILVMCRRAKLYILDEPLGGLDPANPVAGVYDVTFTYNADTSVSKTVKVHVWNEDHSFLASSNNSDYGYLFFNGETLNGVEAGGQYPHLWLVEIRAIAKPGCEFEGWYLVKNMETHVDYEFLSAEETYSFEITEDTVLEARFKEASNG